VLDNQLAVFEFPRATATLRTTLLEVSPGPRRQLVVCGDQGTIEIRPLEPPAVSLTLSKPRGGYKAGTQAVTFPKMPGRYDDHLLELARIIRGEKESEYTPEHDLIVEETLLRASGLPVDGPSSTITRKPTS
jgi:hypothetical protein